MTVLCSGVPRGRDSGQVCGGCGEALSQLTSMRVQLPHLHQSMLTCGGQD